MVWRARASATAAAPAAVWLGTDKGRDTRSRRRDAADDRRGDGQQRRRGQRPRPAANGGSSADGDGACPRRRAWDGPGRCGSAGTAAERGASWFGPATWAGCCWAGRRERGACGLTGPAARTAGC